MKKLFTAVFALLIGILSLTGCAPREIEQTNKSLTVAYYGTDFGSANDILNTAAARFRIEHPDVELIIEREPYADFDEEEEAYFTQLAARVMAGKGPDLFWIKTNYMDVYKMMNAGAFADLAPFVDADPDFAGDAFNTAVVDGCRYQEHLYVMPLSYKLTALMGRKELLDEAGFDYTATDCISQWEELARYARLYAADPSLPKAVKTPTQLDEFPNCAGIPWLDVENRQADLSDSRWKTLFDSYQLLYQTMTEEEKADEDFLPPTAAELAGRDFLFEEYINKQSLSNMIIRARLMAKSGTPYFYPLYDVNGGVQAQVNTSVGVSRTSPNQQNAYDFIKLLLEPERQYVSGSFAPAAFPLSNEALKNCLDRSQQELTGTWAFVDKSFGISDLYPLPDETVQSILEATKKVDGAYFRTETRRRFYTSMADYLEGKVSYEEAIKEAEAALKIYVSE